MRSYVSMDTETYLGIITGEPNKIDFLHAYFLFESSLKDCLCACFGFVFSKL